jgi:hypothetical protein
VAAGDAFAQEEEFQWPERIPVDSLVPLGTRPDAELSRVTSLDGTLAQFAVGIRSRGAAPRAQAANAFLVGDGFAKAVAAVLSEDAEETEAAMSDVAGALERLGVSEELAGFFRKLGTLCGPGTDATTAARMISLSMDLATTLAVPHFAEAKALIDMGAWTATLSIAAAAKDAAAARQPITAAQYAAKAEQLHLPRAAVQAYQNVRQILARENLEAGDLEDVARNLDAARQAIIDMPAEAGAAPSPP